MARDIRTYVKWKRKRAPYLKLSVALEESLANFDNFGIVKHPVNFESITEYLNKNYLENIELARPTEFPVQNIIDKDAVEGGVEINAYLSLKDPMIQKFILGNELVQILKQYYGGQYFLRNNPTLIKYKCTKPMVEMAGNFHVDRFNQISLMLLLNNISEEQTHMEYIMGTQKRGLFNWEIHLEDSDCKKQITAKNYGPKDIYKLVGPKGSAFLFNSMGIHRANQKIGTTRCILHLNFTNGHNLYPFVEKVDEDIIQSDLIENKEI